MVLEVLILEDLAKEGAAAKAVAWEEVEVKYLALVDLELVGKM